MTDREPQMHKILQDLGLDTTLEGEHRAKAILRAIRSLHLPPEPEAEAEKKHTPNTES